MVVRKRARRRPSVQSSLENRCIRLVRYILHLNIHRCSEDCNRRKWSYVRSRRNNPESWSIHLSNGKKGRNIQWEYLNAYHRRFLYPYCVCVCVCESKTHWGIYRDYDIVYSNVKKYLKFEQNINKLLLNCNLLSRFYTTRISKYYKSFLSGKIRRVAAELSIFEIFLLPTEI